MVNGDRYTIYRGLYGEEGYSRIANAKILVVGAGGIGCEILKNLALIGCKQIDLVDLDTIDVSNLNRQFLFRPEHVGHSKAVIAAKAAERFNPDVKVTAYHDNIKGARFNTFYFAKFDVVLNALDNLEARRHVNRLCLAAKVPLFDAGTTGYLGQVMPIVKGLTACYECFPKPSPKVYPLCTIRSTPDKPVHCIVWAKECFKLLFARPSDSALFEDEAATNEKSEYMHLITFPQEKTLDALLAFSKKLMVGLFHGETQKRIDMNLYKTAAKQPEPVDEALIDAAVSEVKKIIESNPHTWKYDRYEAPGLGWEQKSPLFLDALVDFILCLVEVGANEEMVNLIGQFSFDKDDFWAMRFVSACANIRSAIFSIPILSFHDVKGIAGNIIPAIATTNAIVSGAQVALALKCLAVFTKEELYNLPSQLHGDETSRKNVLDCMRKVFPHTYCVRHPNRKGYFLQPSVPDFPVSSCYVCGTSVLILTVDTDVFTLKDFVMKVLKGKLGFNEPEIAQGSNILYEEGDGADEALADNLPLTLAACPGGGIQNGAKLEISDFTQNLKLTLVVFHRSNAEFEALIAAEEEKQKSGEGMGGGASSLAVDMFILEGKQAEAARAETEANKAAICASSAGVDNTSAAVDAEEDDDVMIIDEADFVSSKEKVGCTFEEKVKSPVGKKRGRDEDIIDMDDVSSSDAKRVKNM